MDFVDVSSKISAEKKTNLGSLFTSQMWIHPMCQLQKKKKT